MTSVYDHLTRILSNAVSSEQRLAAMRGFASELEWTPSFELHNSYGVEGADDHLIVEHGLENSAIISFLKAPRRTADLDTIQLRTLLTISYNNLVEWHIFVSETEVRYVNNLTQPFLDSTYRISRASIDYASADQFEKIISAHLSSASAPARSLQSCDDALIQVVSRWKRLLKADYRGYITNEQISCLFNALIFVRACEDERRTHLQLPPRLLVHTLESMTESDTSAAPEISVVQFVIAAIRQCGIQGHPEILESNKLATLPNIDASTMLLMCVDFYRPSFGAYEFDFALMSKHALSRIYERYVSLLEFDEDDERQFSFIAPVPTEKSPTKTGAIYTPLFIAGFFGRFLRDNLTPKAFRQLRSMDPACGSGIFLRTLLELQCNPLVPGTTPQTINVAFEHAFGVDRDPNACQATRLSLSLLHLVATGSLPSTLNVRNEDSIKLAISNDLPGRPLGAILANPPYVKLDHLSQEERESYRQYLADNIAGRVDSYLAFMKLCLDYIDEGGFVCLVLPQVFLMANNAKSLRQRIASSFDVRCLVDLSAVSVFDRVGTYSILIILQRRISLSPDRTTAHVAKVQGFVGPALQAVLDGKRVRTNYYQVFDVDQSYFLRSTWTLLDPTEIEVGRKLSQFRPLSTYLDVRQGFVTGADDIFIRRRNVISKKEQSIFIDYLPDREISRFRLPAESKLVVFYPFEDGEPITERRLRNRYPITWEYLSSHRQQLRVRKSVTSGDTPWWRPVRPREPAHLLRPKIVCPHLMLAPRFGLDVEGKYAVSHSPFLIAVEPQSDPSFLKFFCAVLNSSVCHWFITAHAPKYSRGYNRIEVATLRTIPVPDPVQVPAGILKEIVRLVNQLLERPSSIIEASIDQLVTSLYGLTEIERDLIMGVN